MDKIKYLMDERIESELLDLSNLDSGSDEKTKAIADLDKLYRLRIEEIKVINENEKLKAEQNQKKLDRIFNAAINGGIAIGGWICYDIWSRRGFKFEQTGSVSTPWLRNLISKMLPGKK